MTEVYRNLIVPTTHVDLARKITETLAPVGGRGMWISGLSPDGNPPRQYWFSMGYIDAEFAALLPLIEYIDDAGNWIANYLSAGYPEVIFALYSQAIQIQSTEENPEPDPVTLDFTLADVEAMLSAVDVTTETPQQAWARLGVQLVTADAED